MNIYIAKNGTRLGPYSIQQLRELIFRAELCMSDKAWYEGCTGWTRISELPVLVSAVLPPLRQGPPPIEHQAQAESRVPSPSTSSSAKQSGQGPIITKTSTSKIPPSLWPQTWLQWTFALIIGAFILLVALAGGAIGFFVILGLFLIATVWILIQRFIEKSIEPDSSREYGMKHVVWGRVIVAFALMVTLLTFLALYAQVFEGAHVYIPASISLGMFATGFGLIKKGKGTMHCRKGP